MQTTRLGLGLITVIGAYCIWPVAGIAGLMVIALCATLLDLLAAAIQSRPAQ